MMYIERAVASVVRNISETFPVLLLTGPRQVGKTTLLEHLREKKRSYVTLDDLDDRELARRDPALFLQRYEPPVIIDEVQYAPELFSQIKIRVDREKKNGLFWLTGSQKFELMQGVSETLAGRVGICEVLGLSQQEIYRPNENISPFIPTKDYIASMFSKNIQGKNLKDLYFDIWRGSYPKIITESNLSREIFYSSYIQTYIQRDVRDLSKIGSLITFQRFLKAAAARTGQLINYADMARDVDVDQKTIKEWISILEASGLIYLLHPFHTNITNRIIKTPKLYFLDTGLCSYLTGWTTAASLESGAMSGAILETYVISELLKTFLYSGLKPQFYFYRDRDQIEIDLLIDYDNILYPIECKKTAAPTLSAGKSFHVLGKLGVEIGHGTIFCLKEKAAALSESISAFPVSFI